MNRRLVLVFSLLALSGAPAASGDPSELYLPFAAAGPASADGAWQTDLELFNPQKVSQPVDLHLQREGKPPLHRSVQLGPGESRRLDDVVAVVFGSSSGGALRIVSPRLVVARTFVFRRGLSEGRMSQLRLEASPASSTSLEVLGLARGGGSAGSFLHLMETDGSEVEVELTFSSVEGAVLLRTSRTVGSWSVAEVDVDSLPIDPQRDLHVAARVVQGAGRIAATGLIYHRERGDGVVVGSRALLEDRTARQIEPAASHARRRRAVSRVYEVEGQVAVTFVMPVPEEQRTKLESSVALLEANGLDVADDLSSVSSPPFPAAGWVIAFGGEKYATDDEGKFRLTAFAGGPIHAEVFDPRFPMALGTFSIRQLSDQQRPGVVLLELPFAPPCNMNTADSEVQVCQTGGSKHSHPEPHATYPPTPRESFCQQLDGYVDDDFSALLAYFGSTCWNRVRSGCCPNEGGYGFGATICCLKNHRGRYCQELKEKDIEIKGEALNLVDLGEVVRFTLHNNSCFGRSHIYTSIELGGSLSGPGLQADRVLHYDPTLLAAFNCSGSSKSQGYAIWKGDRELTYRAPRCASVQPGAEDSYSFEADVKGIKFLITGPNVTFRLRPDFLFRFVGDSVLFSVANAAADGWRLAEPDRGCSAMHVHGAHPCSGAADPDPAGCGHGVVEKVR